MRRKRRIISTILFTFKIIFLLSLSATCIYYGLYFNNLAKPRNIIGSNLELFRDFFQDYFIAEAKYNVGDNFSINGTVKYNLSSDLYYRQAASDVESLKKYKYLANLSKMNTSFSLNQSRDSKKIFCNIENKIGVEDIYTASFYSEDSTKYYKVNGLLPNYVNYGNFNYFENFGEEINTGDNLKYLYNYLFVALKNGIPSEEIKEYDVTQNINGESVDTHQVSVKFTNTVIRDTLSNVVEEFKKDERANSIITNVYDDFSNYTPDNDAFYLDSDESYTINIYTTKLFYKPLKYEIVYIHGNERKTYYFDILDDGGTWYVVDGDKVVYEAKVTIKDKQVNAVINDSNSNEVGSLKIEKDNTGVNYSYNLDSGNNKRDIEYSLKYSDVNKHKSYNNTRKISLKIIDDNVSRLSGDIEINTSVSNDVSIMEDISDSVLSSTLTDEVKTKLDNNKNTIKERLEK